MGDRRARRRVERPAARRDRPSPPAPPARRGPWRRCRRGRWRPGGHGGPRDRGTPGARSAGSGSPTGASSSGSEGGARPGSPRGPLRRPEPGRTPHPARPLARPPRARPGLRRTGIRAPRGTGAAGRPARSGPASPASRSAAAVWPPGPSPAGSSRSGIAGTSRAWRSSRAASRKEPDPTGRRPKVAAGRSAGATPSSRWRGAIGWVAASRKPPSGVARVRTTVRSSGALAVTSRHDAAPGPPYSGSLRAAIVNRTSSAVSGCPSCQRRASRRWNVQTDPVGSTSQRSARSPTSASSGPRRTSPRNTRATIARSAAVRALNGLTVAAEPRTPSTYGRTGGKVGAGRLVRAWRARARGRRRRRSGRRGRTRGFRRRPGHGRSSSRPVRPRRPRHAQAVVSSRYAAIEKRTNSTRSAIVNCQSRRSMPRRLR